MANPPSPFNVIISAIYECEAYAVAKLVGEIQPNCEGGAKIQAVACNGKNFHTTHTHRQMMISEFPPAPDPR
jgi:hypothetical protein